jgi:hypothetical protein
MIKKQKKIVPLPKSASSASHPLTPSVAAIFTSFPVHCPCWKCNGTLRNLEELFPGIWICPYSKEVVAVVRK